MQADTRCWIIFSYILLTIGWVVAKYNGDKTKNQEWLLYWIGAPITALGLLTWCLFFSVIMIKKKYKKN